MTSQKSLAAAAASAFGRLGGRVKSPAKTAAARRNALLAGRRPKFAPGDLVRVIDRPAETTVKTRHWGASGEIVSRIGRARYAVRLQDGPVIRLPSMCLRPAKSPQNGRK